MFVIQRKDSLDIFQFSKLIDLQQLQILIKFLKFKEKPNQK